VGEVRGRRGGGQKGRARKGEQEWGGEAGESEWQPAHATGKLHRGRGEAGAGGGGMQGLECFIEGAQSLEP
jgi:hypothetical protein